MTRTTALPAAERTGLPAVQTGVVVGGGSGLGLPGAIDHVTITAGGTVHAPLPEDVDGAEQLVGV
jgi:hypothetical protein